MKTKKAIISLSAGVICLMGVSCKSTKTASGSAVGSSDDFYTRNGGAQGTNTNAYGEYDNIYDQGSVRSVDDYTGDNSSYEYNAGSTGSTNNSYRDYASGNTSAAASPSSGRARYYTVQRGDTLYRIGVNHGVHWTAIQDANNIQGTTIRAGEQLIIPPR